MKQFFQTGPWSSRDLRYALVGRSVSTMGDEVALVALLLAAHGTGGGTPTIASLLLAAALPAVVLAPWAGRLVDRTDSRRLLVVTSLVQAALCVGLAASEPFPAVLLLVAMLSGTQVVAGPAWQALIPHLAGDRDVPRVLGTFQSAALLSGVAGAAVGGLIVAAAGTGAALLLDAGTFLVLAAAALVIGTRRAPVVSGDVPARLLDGWRQISADPLIAPLFSGLLAFVVAGEITNVAEVVLVTEVLGGGPVAFGMLGAIFGLAAAGGSAVGSRCGSDEVRARAAVCAAVLLATMTIAAGASPTIDVLAAAWSVGGFALGVINVVTFTLLVTRIPERRRGQVLATAQGLARGCSLAATALGGLLGAVLGPRLSFVSAGTAALVVSVLLGVRVRAALRAADTGSPNTQGPTCGQLGNFPMARE